MFKLLQVMAYIGLSCIILMRRVYTLFHLIGWTIWVLLGHFVLLNLQGNYFALRKVYQPVHWHVLLTIYFKSKSYYFFNSNYHFVQHICCQIELTWWNISLWDLHICRLIWLQSDMPSTYAQVWKYIVIQSL